MFKKSIAALAGTLLLITGVTACNSNPKPIARANSEFCLNDRGGANTYWAT